MEGLRVKGIEVVSAPAFHLIGIRPIISNVQLAASAAVPIGRGGSTGGR